jgi:hypothetical protein
MSHERNLQLTHGEIHMELADANSKQESAPCRGYAEVRLKRICRHWVLEKGGIVGVADRRSEALMPMRAHGREARGSREDRARRRAVLRMTAARGALRDERRRRSPRVKG